MLLAVLAGLASFAVAVVLGRVALARLVGPVLIYDVIRSSRRGRFFLYRTLYAGGMLALLVWVWLTGHARADTVDRLQSLGEVFFAACAGIQFAAVCVLTPGTVAGCIADEKGSRTLEFLLATDLRSREIVLGKIAARVGSLLMLLLAGLPVISLVQLIGGIDPTVMLLIYAATGLTLLGLTGVSVVQSVQRRRGRDAILLAYLTVAAYLGLSWLAWTVERMAAGASGTVLGTILDAARPALEAFRWGDPLWAYGEALSVINTSGPHGAEYLRILGRYAAFHLTIFAAGLAYGVWRLRPIALAQAGRCDAPAARRRRRSRRPAVSAHRPMIWKELYADGGVRVGPLGSTVLHTLMAIGFAPLGVILTLMVADSAAPPPSWDAAVAGINRWLRGFNAILGCLMLLGIAVRAAGAIRGEIDRDTLPSLLTTPLTAGDIVFGKFVGAIAGVRLLAYWLAAAWAVGVVTTAVNPLALLAEPLVLAPPAGAAAGLGLYFSATCQTTGRAMVATLLVMLFGLGGHWALGCLCCYAPLAFGGGPDAVGYVLAFQAGATPPAMLALLPLGLEENWYWQRDVSGYFLAGVFGLLAWIPVALALYQAALRRFAHASNRLGPYRPEAAR